MISAFCLAASGMVMSSSWLCRLSVDHSSGHFEFHSSET